MKTASPILFSLAIFSPWLHFYINTPKTTIDYVGVAASENNFLSAMANSPEAFSTTVCSLVNFDSWHYLWPAFLVVLIFSLFRRQSKNYFLLLAAFLPFMGFSFAFQLYPLGFNYVMDMIVSPVYVFTNLVPHWVSMWGNYALYPKKIFVSPPGEIFIGNFGKIQSNENITWEWLRNNGIKSVVLFEGTKSGSMNYGAVPMENYYYGKVLPFLRERNKNIHVFSLLDQGARFLRKGIYGKALKIYKKVLSINPDDALAQKGFSSACDELRKRGFLKEECGQL